MSRKSSGVKAERVIESIEAVKPSLREFQQSILDHVIKQVRELGAERDGLQDLCWRLSEQEREA